jgi:hypothetical protein
MGSFPPHPHEAVKLLQQGDGERAEFEIKWPPELKSLSSHQALLSAKFNDVRLDGELYNSAGITFVADVVNACDELTERPGSLRGFGFHNPKSK